MPQIQDWLDGLWGTIEQLESQGRKLTSSIPTNAKTIACNPSTIVKLKSVFETSAAIEPRWMDLKIVPIDNLGNDEIVPIENARDLAILLHADETYRSDMKMSFLRWANIVALGKQDSEPIGCEISRPDFSDRLRGWHGR